MAATERILLVRGKYVVGAILACLAAAYVALLPQFYLMYEQGNRLALGWTVQGRTGILLAIVLLAGTYGLAAGALWVVARLLERWVPKVSWRRLALGLAMWFMTVLLLRAVMAIAVGSEQLPAWLLHAVDSRPAKWLAYLILPPLLLALRPARYARAMGVILRIILLAFLLFLGQMFLWETRSASDPLVALNVPARGEAPGGSLYLFLFDEWDYNATFGDPGFSLEPMPNLRRLLEHSMFYRQAYSPGVETVVSVPRFLFQPDERIHELSFPELESLVRRNALPSRGFHSLFDLSDRHFSFISGYYLPYRDLLGGRVDAVIPVYDDAARYTLGQTVRGLLSSQLAFLRRFGIDVPHANPFVASGWVATARENQMRMRPMLNLFLNRLPAPNISFFHLFLPHPPTFVNRDWSPRSYAECFGPEAYREGVYAIDALIGDLERILTERGEFDSSMIVLFSDHGLKEKYDRPSAELDAGVFIPEKHVPLIIKFPGQTRAGVVDRPTLIANLHPIFRDFLQEPDVLKRWVEQWNAGKRDSPAYPPE